MGEISSFLDFERGQTLYNGSPPPTVPAGLLGKHVVIKDNYYGTGRLITLIPVKNSSGIALLPGRIAKMKKSAPFGTEVDGYVTGPTEVGVVVDEFLPAAGVANGDVFWVVYEGPTRVATPLEQFPTGDIAVGDRIAAYTAAASTGTSGGRAIKSYAATSNSSTELASQIAQLAAQLGVAASAKNSTATTAGQDLLILMRQRL